MISHGFAPFACSFDQGLGDVFVIRVAGNAYGSGVAGSIHYAVTHLHVKVVMVLGHEGCGVIRASQLPLDELDNEPDELRTWLKSVRRGVGVDENVVERISDQRARDREAVVRNVREQVRIIHKKRAIASRIHSGELLVVGAFYEKRSGMVDFIRHDESLFAGPCDPDEEVPSYAVDVVDEDSPAVEDSQPSTSEPSASSSAPQGRPQPRIKKQSKHR